MPETWARDPEPDTLRLWHFPAFICQRTGIECGHEGVGVGALGIPRLKLRNFVPLPCAVFALASMRNLALQDCRSDKR